jgi:hypothetical protein
MNEFHKPDVASDMARIHMVFTRATKVAIQQCEQYSMTGISNECTALGFISYIKAFHSLLHAHHMTEDELVFPYFRPHIPDAPYDILSADHLRVGVSLESIASTIEEITLIPEQPENYNQLASPIIEIDKIWYPHISIEESWFNQERISACFTDEEQENIGREFAFHSQKLSGPDFLVMPFMLYNLPSEKRALLARTFPPIVTEQLVPIVWKEKWAPMQPYLLP